MHGVKEIVHRLFLQKKGRVAYDTAQERVYRCLLTDATVSDRETSDAKGLK
jgi:hypothetical protein